MRLPKSLLLLRSERSPINGSETPSHKVLIATASPTKVPGIESTLVAKNITKLFSVCETVPYPRLPIE